MITCKLICGSNSSHLSQLFQGFTSLNRSQEILLSQECLKQDHSDPTKPQHLKDAKRTHLLVIVNDKLKLYYDCHDSHEIDEHAASDVDYYFKRSYKPSTIAKPFKKKVFPLGLNYAVYPAEIDPLEQERLATYGDTQTFRPTVLATHGLPDSGTEPRALFITRVWEPSDNPERPPEKIAERQQLNETRVACIERLRREFGGRFLGGLVHTDYAIASYEHALLPNNDISEKENYFKLLLLYPVCITTTGLHGSIGWKMGEYVAFSRAIVSQKLNHQAPGAFSRNRHYLDFEDPDRCVEQVDKLLSDTALRKRIMKNNFRYYNTYLRPDLLIKRTLKIALTSIKS